MTTLYAQGTGAWNSITWNTQADGLGDTQAPVPGDTVDPNSFTVDCADINTDEYTLNGSFTTSKLYASESGVFLSINWKCATNGGFSQSATVGVMHYSNGYVVDVCEVNVQNYNLDTMSSWVSSYWQATGSGLYNSVTWKAESSGTANSLEITGPQSWNNNTLDAKSYQINFTDCALGSSTLVATQGGQWDCYTWYAQNSGNFASITWKSASVNGATGNNHSSDTLNSNGYTIDVADSDIGTLSLVGDGWTSSKWYSRSQEIDWLHITLYSILEGTGICITQPPTNECTVKFNGGDVINMADADLRGITLDVNNATLWSTFWYAQNDNVTWANQVWNTHQNGYGYVGTPINDNICCANGKVTFNTPSNNNAETDLRYRIAPSETGAFVIGTLQAGISEEDIVSPDYVVIGQKNYTNGQNGTYPTSETSKTEQLIADQAVVASAVASIIKGVSILGQVGTYDVATALTAAKAEQLALDIAEVVSKRGSINSNCHIHGVFGSDKYTPKTLG